MLNVVFYMVLDFFMTTADVKKNNKKQQKKNITLQRFHFTDQVIMPFNIQTTLTLYET